MATQPTSPPTLDDLQAAARLEAERYPASPAAAVPTITVPGTTTPMPVEALADLLAAYAFVSAGQPREEVPPEGDDAYDVLTDWLAGVLS